MRSWRCVCVMCVLNRQFIPAAVLSVYSRPCCIESRGSRALLPSVPHSRSRSRCAIHTKSLDDVGALVRQVPSPSSSPLSVGSQLSKKFKEKRFGFCSPSFVLFFWGGGSKTSNRFVKRFFFSFQNCPGHWSKMVQFYFC